MRFRGAADGARGVRDDHQPVHAKPVTGHQAPSARVFHVMHRGVVTCRPEVSARKVAMMMTAHRIHAVVVTAAAGLPRLVTDREIARALYSGTIDAASADEI